MGDKDLNFEIELAQIGMRYGAFFTIGAAIFAIGGTLLLTMDKNLIPQQTLTGIGFLFFGFMITIGSSFWKAKQIFKLKKDYMTETENLQYKYFSYKDFLISCFRCKRYDGTERKPTQ